LIKKQSNAKRTDSQEEEDEDELDLDLSQDDVVEIKPSIPDRSKLPRSVVKAPVIESSQVEPEREFLSFLNQGKLDLEPILLMFLQLQRLQSQLSRELLREEH